MEKQRAKVSKLRQFIEDLETGRPTTLSLEDYVLAAYQYDQENSNLEERWHSPVWNFAWLLSGHPALKDHDGYDVSQLVFPLLQKVLRQNAEEFWASAFEGLCSEEDVLADFANSFDSVRYPPGSDRLQAAFFHAEREPVTPPHRRTPGYARFISLAFWLGKLSDGEPIFLPCERVARIFGVRPMTVSRWRRDAVADGLLRVTRQHTFVSGGKGQATEFRFNPDGLNAPQAPVGAFDIAGIEPEAKGVPNPIFQTTTQGEIARLSPSLVASTAQKPKRAPYCSGDEWRALGLDRPLGSSVFQQYWKAFYTRDDGLDIEGKIDAALEDLGMFRIEIPSEFRKAAKFHSREE